jgi:hypothetical protein
MAGSSSGCRSGLWREFAATVGREAGPVDGEQVFDAAHLGHATRPGLTAQRLRCRAIAQP